jgi:hypothetical protein
MKTEIPETVKHMEMKRHWWIVYKWVVVQEMGDEEPVYCRAGLRPINEMEEAARQFDTGYRILQYLGGDYS